MPSTPQRSTGKMLHAGRERLGGLVKDSAWVAGWAGRGPKVRALSDSRGADSQHTHHLFMTCQPQKRWTRILIP